MQERSRSLALVYSGMYTGSVLGLAASPHLIEVRACKEHHLVWLRQMSLDTTQYYRSGNSAYMVVLLSMPSMRLSA